MSKPEYKERTIYVRPHGDTWEVFGKTHGRGMILQNLATRDDAIRVMTFLLWAINEFGLDHYGEEMAKLNGAPDGVEYPVVDEEERI